MLLLFPAMISLDVRRVFAGKLDLLCCLRPGRTSPTSMREVTNNDTNEVVARHSKHQSSEFCPTGKKGSTESLKTLSSTKDLISTEANQERCYISCSTDCHQWSLTSFATNHYSNWITKTPVRVLTIIITLALIGASAWGFGKVDDGLDDSSRSLACRCLADWEGR